MIRMNASSLVNFTWPSTTSFRPNIFIYVWHCTLCSISDGLTNEHGMCNNELVTQSSFRKNFHCFYAFLTLKLSLRKILHGIAHHKSSFMSFSFLRGLYLKLITSWNSFFLKLRSMWLDMVALYISFTSVWYIFIHSPSWKSMLPSLGNLNFRMCDFKEAETRLFVIRAQCNQPILIIFVPLDILRFISSSTDILHNALCNIIGMIESIWWSSCYQD